MKTFRLLITLVALMAATGTIVAQNGRNGMSTRAIGHMTVELISPAAVTAVESSAIQISGTSQNVNVTLASAKLTGNATYAVTINQEQMVLGEGGMTLAFSGFTATTDNINTGSNLQIGATLNTGSALAAATQYGTPGLNVAINYN